MRVRALLHRMWHRDRLPAVPPWTSVSAGPVRFDPSLRRAADVVADQLSI